MPEIQGKKILLRADASSRIGIGHVMRCLALAQVWEDMGGRAVFFCFEIPDKLKRLLKKENIEWMEFSNAAIGSTEDAQITVDAARKLGINWIIADGYHFKTGYQQFIKEHEQNLIIADDYGHADFYAADIIVNAGLDIHESLYCNRECYTQLLLGPTYISLRREFLKRNRSRKEINPEANKLLVTMGGADPDQVTIKVLEGLDELEICSEIRVVVGPACGFAGKLKNFTSNHHVQMIQDADDMAALIEWADLGISAGGGTLAEMAFMGLPNVVIKTADNQCSSIFYEKKYGTSLFLGDADQITKEQISESVRSLCKDYAMRRKMSSNGRKLIDGQGSKRIFEVMSNLEKQKN